MDNKTRYCQITKSLNPGQIFETQEVGYQKKLTDAVMIFPYGIFASIPPGDDTLGVLYAIDGNEDKRAALCWEFQNRPDLAQSEVSLYHPKTGTYIIERSNGDLEIVTGNSASGNVFITCATANITAETTNISNDVNIGGNLVVSGNSTTQGDSVFNGSMTNQGKNVGQSHGHAQGDDSGGNSEQPINGVT